MKRLTLFLIVCCISLLSCQKEDINPNSNLWDRNETNHQNQILSDFISVENNRYTLSLTAEEAQQKYGISSEIYINCKQNIQEINKHLEKMEQAGTEIIFATPTPIDSIPIRTKNNVLQRGSMDWIPYNISYGQVASIYPPPLNLYNSAEVTTVYVNGRDYPSSQLIPVNLYASRMENVGIYPSGAYCWGAYLYINGNSGAPTAFVSGTKDYSSTTLGGTAYNFNLANPSYGSNERISISCKIAVITQGYNYGGILINANLWGIMSFEVWGDPFL